MWEFGSPKNSNVFPSFSYIQFSILTYCLHCLFLTCIAWDHKISCYTWALWYAHKYFLERTYLCIHLHLLRIEVIRSCYVSHFPQTTYLTWVPFFKESWLISSSKHLGLFSTLHWPNYSISWPLLSPYSTVVVVVTLAFDGCKWFLVFPWMFLWCCRWLSILPNMFYDLFHHC